MILEKNKCSILVISRGGGRFRNSLNSSRNGSCLDGLLSKLLALQIQRPNIEHIIHLKFSHTVVHMCHPSTWEAEASGQVDPWGSLASQISLTDKFQARKSSASKGGVQYS